MDLRVLFTEMCDGSSNSGSRTSKRRGRKSTKETLSSSNLARGLRHAGLPLDREVVKLLVAAFSTSSAGGPGGRGRRNHHLLSYADFHRMVNCDGLLAVGSTTLGAGSETLDEQVGQRGRGAVGGEGGGKYNRYSAHITENAQTEPSK